MIYWSSDTELHPLPCFANTLGRPDKSYPGRSQFYSLHCSYPVVDPVLVGHQSHFTLLPVLKHTPLWKRTDKAHSCTWFTYRMASSVLHKRRMKVSRYFPLSEPLWQTEYFLAYIYTSKLHVHSMPCLEC